jgi:predicted O-methyltransferase YrrM
MINLKNYLLNKSNRYRYYKTGYAQLKQDMVKLKNDLNILNIELDTITSNNKKLKQKISQLKNYSDRLYYGAGFPLGHFHSPINDIEFLKNREDKIWGAEFIEGIELNEEEQINLFKSFVKYYLEFPFKPSKQSNLRYYLENSKFSYGAGLILYFMIRTLRPKRIIEIGSGFSSALMMDVNDIFFEKKIKLTFIEPNPKRLYSLMSDQDKINNEVIVKIVQNVNLKKFQELKSNDILFIDSSHIVKTGSDVQHIIFKILPKLKSGVYVHFHDIFYPFEYPKNWIMNNRWNFNEDYFLRAFLMYNTQFKIVLSDRYLHKYHNKLFEFMMQDMPPIKHAAGNSLWIKKI